MLRLLSLLQTHRYWPGGDLAERLEVSERTVRRDVDRLRELGYQVDASRGVAGGYQLRSGANMPPLLLDDDEAVAIAVGLRGAAGGAVAGIEETSVRALTKVVQVMPPRLRRQVDALRSYSVPSFGDRGQTIDASTLTTIAQACRDDERLRFGYVARGGEETARHVEPYRLVSTGHRWYLVAWDVERHDWRTFRVDRIAGLSTTGARFRPRELPGGDAAAFVRDRIAAIPNRYHLVVTVRTPAAAIEKLAAYTGATVSPIDAKSCRFVLDADELEWPVMIFAAFRAEFRVEEPAELRDYLRETGEQFLRSVSPR
jgi:predicted DNA-binding transcriptional regulator YafY